MARTLAVGDIHGAHIPLQQCLDRCHFDYEEDTLITMGDICDGWPYVYECVEILLGITHRIDLVGNHDEWFTRWLTRGYHPDRWLQGGNGTLLSYQRHANRVISIETITRGYNTTLRPSDIPPLHIDFFLEQQLYYVDQKNRCFVHGGFHKEEHIELTAKKDPTELYWNRDLWKAALCVHRNQRLHIKDTFTEIFIGHTETPQYAYNERWHGEIVAPRDIPCTAPMHADIIYNLDTGAGSNGRLTIMDVDTHEYWQSDKVNEIYGQYKPRG